MKRFILMFVLMSLSLSIVGQNVGINTVNPEEDLHLRTDSTDVAIRMDSKRATSGFVFKNKKIPPSGVTEEINFFCAFISSVFCIPWNNLDHTRLHDKDDVRVTTDSLYPYDFFSLTITNDLKMNFPIVDSIPSDAIVSGFSVEIDYDTAPFDDSLTQLFGGFSLTNSLPLGGYLPSGGSNPTDLTIYSNSNEELLEFRSVSLIEGENKSVIFTDELTSPMSISEIGNIKVVIPALIHSNPFHKIVLGIDKVSVEVDYYVPVTGDVNSIWKYGVDDGKMLIQSEEVQPFSIKGNGVTTIDKLRIPKGASKGWVLTSNSKGKGSWQPIPSDADKDWRILNDTLESFPVPMKTNSKVSMPFGATLGNKQTIAEAGDIRFDSKTGAFEGYTGAKWLPFTMNQGWGNTLGEEQFSFEKEAPTHKSFGKQVGLRGNNAMAVADSLLVFFTYNETDEEWTEATELVFTDKIFSADLFGDYAAVSFQDKIEIYHYMGGSWTNEHTHNFTFSAIGPTLSLGSESSLAYELNDDIHFLVRSGTSWIPTQTLPLNPPSGYSIKDIDIKGENMLVGATHNSQPGEVYHIRKSFNLWEIEDTITSPVNQTVDDDFGYDISIGGTWLAIGARNSHNTPSDGGRVFMYKFDNNNEKYEFKKEISSPAGAGYNLFGDAVDVSPSSNYMVVGDYASKKAYVFERSGMNWNHSTVLNSTSDISDSRYPDAVQITNDHILIGIPVVSTNVNDVPGRVNFYINN